MQNQIFKTVPTLPTFVFIDGHKQTLNITRRRHSDHFPSPRWTQLSSHLLYAPGTSGTMIKLDHRGWALSVLFATWSTLPAISIEIVDAFDTTQKVSRRERRVPQRKAPNGSISCWQWRRGSWTRRHDGPSAKTRIGADR